MKARSFLHSFLVCLSGFRNCYFARQPSMHLSIQQAQTGSTFTTSSLAWLNSFAGWLQTHCPAIALIFSFSESHTLAEHIYYVLLHCPMETYLLTPNTALFTFSFKSSLFYKLHPASFHVSISSASIHSPSIFEHLLYTRQKYIILDHRDEVAFSALKERPVQRDRWMLDRVLWQLQ